jgi:hypothetical protein
LKLRAAFIIGMILAAVAAACTPQQFPVGSFEPVQPSPTDRITEFSFAPDGTFVSAYYDGKAATGTYAINGDKIVFTELNADSPCLGAPATMTWAASGDKLTLKFYEDLCDAGPSYDWAREWVKIP